MLSKNRLSESVSHRSPSIYLQRHLIVLSFIFRPVIHFMLKLVYMKYVSKFSFCKGSSNCFCTVCWKNYPFSNKLKRKWSLCIFIINRFIYLCESISWIVMLFHWCIWAALNLSLSVVLMWKVFLCVFTLLLAFRSPCKLVLVTEGCLPTLFAPLRAVASCLVLDCDTWYLVLDQVGSQFSW